LPVQFFLNERSEIPVKKVIQEQDVVKTVSGLPVEDLNVRIILEFAEGGTQIL